MNSLRLTSTILLIVLTLLGCKKEECDPIPSYEPNVAPCEIQEELFVIDSITYGGTSRFPQAHMVISFTNTTEQLAFNKIPETGMYHLVPNAIGDYTFENQMATVSDSGSFLVFSYVTEDAEVFVENYNNELIISYCDLSNSGFYDFQPSINAYWGNPSGKRKIRMSY